MSELLLEQVSPNGNLGVMVEEDEHVAYLYLSPMEQDSGFQFKSCWIRNLAPAPAQLDVVGMREGKAPMLPAKYCRHPQGAKNLDASGLEVVWSEEGDGVALYENDRLLAMIVSWSGQNGFHGYAADCVGESDLVWEIGEQNELPARFERAREAWQAWDDEDFWPNYRDAQVTEIKELYGAEPRYFAIDGGNWPPKGLTLSIQGELSVLVTVGVSLRPQPSVEMDVENPEDFRRIELGVCVQLPAPQAKEIARYIRAQTQLPWSNLTWLGIGHTLPADVFEELSEGRFPFALLSTRHPAVKTPFFPDFREDPVRLHWMIPLSAAEREFAIEHGSEELWSRMTAQHGPALASLNRPETSL